MQVIKFMLLVLILLLSSACSNEPVIKYVDKPYRVEVPIKCLVPEAKCLFDKPTDTEVITSMRECIIDMKHNERICQ